MHTCKDTNIHFIYYLDTQKVNFLKLVLLTIKVYNLKKKGLAFLLCADSACVTVIMFICVGSSLVETYPCQRHSQSKGFLRYSKAGLTSSGNQCNVYTTQ